MASLAFVTSFYFEDLSEFAPPISPTWNDNVADALLFPFSFFDFVGMKGHLQVAWVMLRSLAAQRSISPGEFSYSIAAVHVLRAVLPPRSPYVTCLTIMDEASGLAEGVLACGQFL